MKYEIIFENKMSIAYKKQVKGGKGIYSSFIILLIIAIGIFAILKFNYSFCLSYITLLLIASKKNNIYLSDLEKSLNNIKLEKIGKTKGFQRRFKILLAIALREKVDFTTLQKMLRESPGALSHDLNYLSSREVGFIEIERKFTKSGQRKTTYSLTEEGKEALKEYIVSLREVINLIESIK